MANKKKDFIMFDGEIYTASELEEYLLKHPEKKKEYQKVLDERKKNQDKNVAYQKDRYRAFSLKFSREGQQEIIDKLENTQNITEYISSLIQKDMENK